MLVFIGADHRGFSLKEHLKSFISSLGYTVEDCGAHFLNSEDDYPDFAHIVSKKVLESQASRGILICGSGAGISMAANRFKGIRAVLAINKDQVKDAVHDEDANVLCISANYTEEKEAEEITETFLKIEFGNEERYIRRINKLDV